MRSVRVFWGLVLAGFGLILLLLNLGLLPVQFWSYLWAVGLIVLGLWLLVMPVLARGEKTSQQLSIPLEGLGEASITLKHGAGRLSVEPLESSNSALLEGTFGGGVESSLRREGTRGELVLKVPSDAIFTAPWLYNQQGLTWKVGVNPSIPLRLVFNTGAGESYMDLTQTQVKELQLETGASSSEVVLPAAAGYTRAAIKSGMAAVVLRIPQQVAARIEVKSGMAGVDVDTHRFGKYGDVYQSPDYETAANRADIRIETGVGSVTVR